MYLLKKQTQNNNRETATANFDGFKSKMEVKHYTEVT